MPRTFWIAPVQGGFGIKTMFGSRSDFVSNRPFPTAGAARGQIMRWVYGIERSPV